MDAQAERILEVARGVVAGLDLETVLERLLEAARELTDARYAALGVLDPSREEIERFITLGLSHEQRATIGHPPTGRGVLGDLISDPTPVRIPDVAAHPDSVGFPSGHPRMRSFLGVPILVDGAAWGNLYLTEKREGEFTASDEQAAVSLAAFAALAIDNAARYGGSEAERHQLQRTVEALDATLQIAQALGGETDLSVILALVAQRGRELVGARVLLIELLSGDELEIAAGAGDIPDGLIGRRIAVDGTVASVALRQGHVQHLNAPENRERFRQHGAGRFGLDADHGLVVPLIFRDRHLGVLVAFAGGRDGALDPEHERLLEGLAASVATAVATARSFADDRSRQTLAAADAERSRWARELHDETLQALGNLRLLLSGARRRGDKESLRDGVEAAIAQLEDDIANLRSLITELRPAALDQLGLEPALHALIDRSRAAGLEIDARVELDGGSARLRSDLETGVYRIVQEALTNAVRHGEASRAEVEVVEADGVVRVSVRDDGAGFDDSALRSGFGIVGMRERAQLLGGELAVRSSPGAGSRISVELPAVRRAP